MKDGVQGLDLGPEKLHFWHLLNQENSRFHMQATIGYKLLELALLYSLTFRWWCHVSANIEGGDKCVFV